MTKCDHNACQFDANNKQIPEAKQADAVWRITGYVGDSELVRCQKHFEAFDLLHQAVLKYEQAGGPTMSRSSWSPTQVRYMHV